MRWRAVARRDVQVASRSRAIWLLFALLVVVVGATFAVHYYREARTFTDLLARLADWLGLLVPILGLLVGYKSVVGERKSGGLYLTLSLPQSRADLLVGKFVGRSVVLLAPTLVALLLVGAAGAAIHGPDGLLTYPLFLLATSLYALAFVGLGMGLSMATTSDRWITLGALGGYLVLVVLWEALHTVTLLVLHRFDATVFADIPDWALLFRMAKPGESYYRLLQAGLDVPRAEGYVGGDVPAYVDWWMALAILLAWTLVPLVLGFRRFDRADL